MLSLKIGYFFIIECFGVLGFENAKPHIKQKKPTYKGELVKYKQIKNQPLQTEALIFRINSDSEKQMRWQATQLLLFLL